MMKNANLSDPGVESLPQIYDLLYRLGITANYVGFFHASHAVYLAARQPECLLQVTKWLYPEVARHYGTTWSCVERNIRTVAGLAWSGNRAYLENLARRPLQQKPRPSQFLAILSIHISPDLTA